MIYKTLTTLLVLGLTTVSSPAIGTPNDKVSLSENRLDLHETIEYNPVVKNDSDYAKLFDRLPIRLKDGKTYRKDSKHTSSSLNHCKSLVYRTIKSLPKEHSEALKNLTLYFTDKGRRGMAGGNTLILRCKNLSDAEIVSVLVHELGHILDTGQMNGRRHAGASKFRDFGQVIYNDDLSIGFYNISWVDENSRKTDSLDLDFVSGYATSDPFEDFAETYNFYVLHNKDFKNLTKNNKKLELKYEYMKNVVFQGYEYNNDSMLTITGKQWRPYDTTVLNYTLDNFFSV